MGERDLLDVVLGLLPFFLGVAAWFVLAIPTRRTRGALLFAFCVGTVLVPAEYLLRTTGDAAGAVQLLTSTGGLMALLVLGCVFVAAGNRQQKRTLGRGLAPALTGLGGIAILVAFLYPCLPTTTSDGGLGDEPVAALFLRSDVWEGAWFLLIWILGLFVFGLLGALSFFAVRLGDGFAEWVQSAISRLARLLPISLPVIVLVAYVVIGLPGFGYFFLFVAKVGMQTYGIFFLAAIGLARVLDDADPGVVWVQEDVAAESGEAAPQPR